MRVAIGTLSRAACDALIAVAAVLLVLAARWPWFKATLLPVGRTQAGFVMAPRGLATGLFAHRSLWVVVGVAAVQLALLLLRYYQGGRLRVRGDGIVLAVGSGLVCLIVAADIVLMPVPWADILSVNGSFDVSLFGVPVPWEGTPYPLDGYTLVMTYSYGALVAIAAALASLALTVGSLAVIKVARMSRSEPFPVHARRR